jgi:hypothetical protein
MLVSCRHRPRVGGATPDGYSHDAQSPSPSPPPHRRWMRRCGGGEEVSNGARSSCQACFRRHKVGGEALSAAHSFRRSPSTFTLQIIRKSHAMSGVLKLRIWTGSSRIRENTEAAVVAGPPEAHPNSHEFGYAQLQRLRSVLQISFLRRRRSTVAPRFRPPSKMKFERLTFARRRYDSNRSPWSSIV